jgi:sulfur carrier protein ThiS
MNEEKDKSENPQPQVGGKPLCTCVSDTFASLPPDLRPRSKNTMSDLRKVTNQSEITVEAGHTLPETLAALQIQPEVVAGVVVNSVLQSKAYTLQDEDDVKLFTIMSGG